MNLVTGQKKTFKFIKAVSETVLDSINAIYHDKPLTFTGSTFREKLVFHYQAVNEAGSLPDDRRRVPPET